MTAYKLVISLGFILVVGSSYPGASSQTTESVEQDSSKIPFFEDVWDFIVFLGSSVYDILRPYDYMDFTSADTYIRSVVLFMEGRHHIKERGSYFHGSRSTDVIKNSVLW